MGRARSAISPMKTVGTFLLTGRACSDTLLHVLDRAFDQPLTEEECAAMPFAGGIMQHGYQCGMIWGATLAAGARAHRLLGDGPQAEARAVVAAGRLVEAFRAIGGKTDCFDITGTDGSSSTLQMITHFLVKGGTIGCCRMAARYAPAAFREMEAVLSEREVEAPPAPVSCSAMLARKMGASEMHAVMAAGFAGGIGLSGGACGALGAAIWVLGLNGIEQGAGKVGFKAPAALEAVDRFLRCTGYEFECSTIVGRKFESIEDHARHLRGGGCSKIIEALAARRSDA